MATTASSSTSATIILKNRTEAIDTTLADATILRDFNLYVANGSPKGGIYNTDRKGGTLAVDFREVQLILGK